MQEMIILVSPTHHAARQGLLRVDDEAATGRRWCQQRRRKRVDGLQDERERGGGKVKDSRLRPAATIVPAATESLDAE